MFRLAVEACPHGMVMVDGAGNMIMVNAGVEGQFGYRRDELIGRPVDMLIPARRGSDAISQRTAFGAGAESFGSRKDGSQFPIEFGLTLIPNGHGLLVLGTIVDISDRKIRDRLKDEFVSTVSHELRNRGFAESEAATAAMNAIRDIAHGLAGAGGIFGHPEISDAAIAVEQAIVAKPHGSDSAPVLSALSRLLVCMEARNTHHKATPHFLLGA